MLFTKYYGVTILEYIILFIIIIVIFTYIYIQFRAKSLKDYVESTQSNFDLGVKHQNLTWNTLDDLMENADNGDLVFMSGDTKGERMCRWCTDSMYSHVGMLFREKHPETGENILYIWDADLGQQMKDGPRVQRLQDKLDKYKGFPYLMWRKLFSNERPSTENIMKVVEKYKNHTFNNYMWKWWANKLVNVETGSSVFCSELIALTMQDANIGMMSSDKSPAWYSPESFAYLIEGLKDGFSYGSHVFVKFK